MGRRPRKGSGGSGGYVGGWYDWRRDLVCLRYRSGGREGVDEIPFRWHFYLTVEDYERARRRRIDEVVDDVVVGKRHVRVFASYPDRRELARWLRDEVGVQPLEMDANPVLRYVSRNPIRFARPRVLFYDFETDPRLGWVTDDAGNQRPHPDTRILSVAWRTEGEGRTRFRRLDCHPDMVDDPDSPQANEAECELLMKFLGVVGRHDLIVAWNGRGFDEPLLKHRCDVLGIDVRWQAVSFLDFMVLFQHTYMRDAEGSGVRVSYSLDNIARTVLGKRKVRDVPGGRMFEVWRDEPDLLRVYNKRDVKLMAELEAATGYIASHTTLAHLCNRFPSDLTLFSGYLCDGYLLKHGEEHDVHFKTKAHVWDEKTEAIKIEGAFVMEPEVGLHEGVHCLDFGSLYPNIIRTFNISPDTLLGLARDVGHVTKGSGKCEAFNHAVFDTTRLGAVAQIVESALDGRAEHKKLADALEAKGKEGSMRHRLAKQRSDAWKVLGNSYYGLLGSPYSRIYEPLCAEAVTLTGQAIIKAVIEMAQLAGVPVLYGDTDSIFVRCTLRVAKQLIKRAAKVVDAAVEERGGRPGLIRLKVDATYERIFWTNKKRYAGLKSTGKWDVKGLELVRSDGCRFERELQREVIRALLEDGSTPDEIAATIRERNEQLFGGDVDVADLAVTVKLGKPVDEYKGDVPQVRVARMMIAEGREVYVGMKIPYVVVGKHEGGTKAMVIPLEDCDGEYDPAMYWKKVYPAAERILTAVFPDRETQWKALRKLRPTRQRSLI